MPLHDWTDDRGWDSVHRLWINSLLFWIQDRLPAGYRAYLGPVPGLAIAAESSRPASPLVDEPQPDFQAVALLNPESPSTVHVFHQGRLVAAVELVSPRNDDRHSWREFYRNRYIGYVWSGVNLLLADVHRRPSGYSFVEAMAGELQCQFPIGLPPHAVSWNVGGPTPDGGLFLDGWYRALAVGDPLPSVPLVLTTGKSLLIDLEHTYAAAAHRAYLD